ncbi:DUF302 domain-containing protein [Aestuariirhabdus sp. Z084]|uniref:DUF302 domain-containing protein n=1 Tax=Aestuariirhabdus haliotis TaxID=2918751 RepID=UPI00201B3532|nr:DUF302 domain-containing protein [Aestuariirhabdus haliotis]MCL6416276.1 DUF302 domain-containing protein [Aestuariirhabdus haliotis]MCL6420149.1 DUF302 domain-containing protein [Aestuariirhabdus haliotis]
MKWITRILAGLSAMAILAGLPIAAVQADDGLVWVRSAHSVANTSERLQAMFKKKGVTLFARVDHAKGAMSVGNDLAPTELLIFGNPKLGTPLMKCQPSVAIDLPQKMLISEDNKGQVWISYNAPAYLAERHQMQGCAPVLKKIATVLETFASKAAAP